MTYLGDQVGVATVVIPICDYFHHVILQCNDGIDNMMPMLYAGHGEDIILIIYIGCASKLHKQILTASFISANVVMLAMIL